jgi:hypothetical protein
VGLFGFLRKNDERAIPEPGTPEFEAAVRGSALPDAQSVSMGQPGWADPSSAESSPDPSTPQVEGSSQTIDLRDTDAREQIEEALRESGIDPNQKGQTIDASSVPGLKEKIAGIIGPMIGIPNAGGFGGGISPPKQDPLDQIAHLDQQRDAGKITDAEFEAQKRKLRGE